MAKAQNEEQVTVETVLDESLEALQLGVQAIRGEIQKIKSGKGGKSKHDKASRIAFLSQRVGAIADSVRKIEAARAKRGNSITKGLVFEWFKQLNAGEQSGLIRELQALTVKRSGLA